MTGKERRAEPPAGCSKRDVGLFEVLAWSAHTGGEMEDHPNKDGGVEVTEVRAVEVGSR